MYIPSSVCQKLARANPNYRYGLGYLPGQGRVFFLGCLVPRQWAGSDDPNKRPAMNFLVSDLGDRLVYTCDKNGDIPCRVPAGYALALLSWPGQASSFGNADIMSGDHADFLLNHGKPIHVVETERRDAIANAGRNMDLSVENDARELADYWRYLGKDTSSSDYITTKEDTRKGFKDKANEQFFKIHEKDKSVSFETEYLKNAGLE